jgi:ParB-like nuclease domain
MTFRPNSPITHNETRRIDLLKSRRNARLHSPAQVKMIARSLEKFGWVTPVLIDEADVVLAGYGRVSAARELGLVEIPVMVARGWSDGEKRAYMLADNQIALQAGWDEALLKLELDELKLLDFDLTLLGFDAVELRNMDTIGALVRPVGDLKDRFILPPFSILDARSGWWQERKRAWLALGIQSELGRGDNALRYSQTILEPDPKRRAVHNVSGSRPAGHTQICNPVAQPDHATQNGSGLSHPNLQPHQTPSLKGGLTFRTTMDAYRKFGEPL